MLLTLDVGNSAVKGGLFDGDTLTTVFSVSVEAVQARDAPAPVAWAHALNEHLQDRSIGRVGLVSVVPATAEALTEALSTLTDASVRCVHPTMPLPFELGYETPDTLGADRLAAAAAGWVQVGKKASPPCSVLVVDAGTAVTCEVVHREGLYQGGVISAGPALLREALQSGTAQLPPVALTLPDEPIGRSTQTALQSGIMWSLVDTVRGMTDRLAATLPDRPRIVLTGGWGALLARHLEGADHHPHLVLDGVRVLLGAVDR